MPSLTRAEAAHRADLLIVESMEVDLDLDQGSETFGSRARVTFSCNDPGASTFLDVKPVRLVSVMLNGRPVDVAGLADGRIELAGLAASNVVEVEAVMGYRRDGQGLHRAVDPADGEHYVYGHLFLDAGPRVFACFDQPDLKAPYAVTVTAPAGWTVLGNGNATEVAPGRWELSETRPLATYFVTVCAGPYASVRDEHDGIRLGVHARASLAAELAAQAPQLFEVTKQSFDYYHELFGIRYPFAGYEQVFVPEFNAGAMENPGCVTFRDQMIFRGAASRPEIARRANTIAHEMAHMWFGDLVTMRWWDDLWLNESFADYMAHRTLAAATEFREIWIDYSVSGKAWGYAAERSPSTHPVAASGVDDAESALQNFDGISYAKGSAALRQLIAHVGDEAFIAGVREYLRDHSFGNGILADFLAAIERSSGRDLAQWSRAWLETPGLDVIAVDPAGVVSRSAPAAYPASRPHTLDVAGFSGGREVFRVPLVLTEDSTEVAELATAAPAEIVVPNAGDLTWATVALDTASLAAIETGLASVPDAQARAVVWTALIDGVCLGTVDPRLLVRTFGAAWALESSDSVLQSVSFQVVRRVIPTFLPSDEQVSAEAVVAAAAARLLGSAAPGSSRSVLAARTVAGTTPDDGLLRAWAADENRPEGLSGDSDFGWIAVRTLARRGLVDEAFIEAAQARDDTFAGTTSALTARASLPMAAAKEWAWGELTGNRTRTNYELNALAEGFWLTPDPVLTRPYVAAYFRDIPALAQWLGEDALAQVATFAYPARVVEPETLALSEATLVRGDLTPAVRRSIVDAESRLREALRSRARFG